MKSGSFGIVMRSILLRPWQRYEFSFRPRKFPHLLSAMSLLLNAFSETCRDDTLVLPTTVDKRNCSAVAACRRVRTASRHDAHPDAPDLTPEGATESDHKAHEAGYRLKNVTHSFFLTGLPTFSGQAGLFLPDKPIHLKYCPYAGFTSNI